MHKNLNFIAAIACLALNACCVTPTAETLKIYQVEPLSKVLYTDSLFTDNTDTLWAARGENICFQLVLTSQDSISGLKAITSGGSGLGEVHTGWVHDVYNTNQPWLPDGLWTPEKMYPDPIFDDLPESINQGRHRTIWIDVAVPRSAIPGIKTLNINVSGKDSCGKVHRVSKKLTLKVCNATLPEEQSLKVVNWFSRGDITKLNPDADKIEAGSDDYLNLLSILAKTAAAYGQNCYLIPYNPQLRLNSDSTDFIIDFEVYDKVVEVLEKYGNMKTFCNGHFGSRAERGQDWNLPFVFNISYVKDKKLCNEAVRYDDPRLEKYINRYYSIIENHFRDKGWLDICYQHIADEPAGTGTESQKSWSYVAGLVKKAAPGLRTIDASGEIIENQDVSVVVLGENIATMPPVPEGGERWMYTCCVPGGEYANRFVQQQLIKTRILHWLNFRYNEVGYLHWGYNYWYFSDDPLHNVTPKGEWWPGGDAWIVYPGNRKVYPSIRLCAMRDGIRDYELLRMVEAIDPDKAMEFSNRVIKGPYSYDNDPANFRSVRHDILNYLSGN